MSRLPSELVFVANSRNQVAPPPFYVFLVQIDFDWTEQDYAKLHGLLERQMPHYRVPYTPSDRMSIGIILKLLLPFIIMHFQSIPRDMWQDYITRDGRRFIYRRGAVPHPLMTSYNIYSDRLMSGLVGLPPHPDPSRLQRVGIGIKNIDPDYLENHYLSILTYSHQLAYPEFERLMNTTNAEAAARCLSAILALKQAIMNALGPYFRLAENDFEVDLMTGTLKHQSVPIHGWQFNVITVEDVHAANATSGRQSIAHCAVIGKYAGSPSTTINFIPNSALGMSWFRVFGLRDLLSWSRIFT